MQISNNYYVSNVSINSKQKVSNPKFKAVKSSALLSTAALTPLSAAMILIKPLPENTRLQLIDEPKGRHAKKSDEPEKVFYGNVVKLQHIDTSENNKYQSAIDRIVRKNKWGWSRLELVCADNNNPEVIENLYELLAKDAFLAREIKKVKNPLELACAYNNNPEAIGKLYELLGKDAFLAREEKDVMNPLELACAHNNNPEVIKKLYELLGKDVFLDSEDKHNRSPLEIACVNNENPKVIAMLCKLFGIGIFLKRRNPLVDSPRDLMIRYNINPDVRKELDTIRALPKCKF